MKLVPDSPDVSEKRRVERYGCMKFFRRNRLAAVLVCLCLACLSPAGAQTRRSRLRLNSRPSNSRHKRPSGSLPRNNRRHNSRRPNRHRSRNPFETVPQTNQPAQPAQQPTQQPTRAPHAEPAAESQARSCHYSSRAGRRNIESIEFRGARRVPQDTLQAMIVTKPGDIYNEDLLRRDFMALWNTGRFDDIRSRPSPAKRASSSASS